MRGGFLEFSMDPPPPSLVSDTWQFPPPATDGGTNGRRRQRVLAVSDEHSPADADGGTNGRRRQRVLAVSDEHSPADDPTGCEVKRIKVLPHGDEQGDIKGEAEASPSIQNKRTDENTKPLDKQDYIHVRARRGQATDSHSLAERARREKINERMKILQDLVPGCSKIIGKASVLDEIINYVQSLQRQVEFLSMKLEAVDSRINSDDERFPSKDMYNTALGTQPANEYGQISAPDWLHMHIGGTFERVT